MKRFGQIYPDLNAGDPDRFDEYMEHFVCWQQCSDYMAQFITMTDRVKRQRVMKNIVHTVGFSSINYSKALTVIDSIKPPRTGFDKLSLLHAGHITRTRR
jgi:hypothetical protein